MMETTLRRGSVRQQQRELFLLSCITDTARFDEMRFNLPECRVHVSLWCEILRCVVCYKEHHALPSGKVALCTQQTYLGLGLGLGLGL